MDVFPTSNDRELGPSKENRPKRWTLSKNNRGKGWRALNIFTEIIVLGTIREGGEGAGRWGRIRHKEDVRPKYTVYLVSG